MGNLDNVDIEYVPRTAIVFYDRPKYGQGDHSPIVRLFPIEQVENNFVFGAGRAVSLDDLNNLGKEFNNVQDIPTLKTKSLIPATVMFYKGNQRNYEIIWYKPPGQHHMQFKLGLAIKTGVYLMPGFVFKAERKSLQVYAYKGSEAPNAETELYAPPVFNTSMEGNVCTGNIKISPNKNFVEDNIKEWEKGFFASVFTHVGDTSIKKGMNINDLYKKMKGKTTGFPESVLIKLKKKVESLI